MSTSDAAPEQVALELLRLVAASKGKALDARPADPAHAGRKYILDTYAECLSATEGARSFQSSETLPAKNSQ